MGSAGAQVLPLVGTETHPEVLLKNGSSYVILTENLRLTQGTLIGFSFRTCLSSGELLRQIGNSNDLLTLSLTQTGGVLLTLESGEDRRSLEAGSNLADGTWHTVRLGVSLNLTTVCLSVDGVGPDTECTQPRTGPTVVTQTSETTVSRLENAETLLSSLNLSGSSSQVRVGSGLVGCLRQGPGLRFTEGRVTDFSGVEWAPCVMPDTCAGGTRV